MKKLNSEDFKNLEYGQKVVVFKRGEDKSYRFVAKMPSCENYLIFEDGTNLTYLWINKEDGSFSGDWYSGTYDSKFIGKLKIQYLTKKIKSIKDIYLKD